MAVRLELAGRSFTLRYPAVMGVLNVTPDSFSDGGAYAGVDAAVARAHAMFAQGAQVIDIGAESTRPGAAPVSEAQELERLTPVVSALLEQAPECILSVDTHKLSVQIAMLELGVPMINDVMGGSPELYAAAAKHGAGLVLMHTTGSPEVMQSRTQYGDVVEEVYAFLAQRVAQAQAAGVRHVWVDAGIGFGKELEHNLALMRASGRFAQLGSGVLVGASRKSWLGKLCGAAVDERLGGSVAAALACTQLGAQLVRVHDVQETVQALAVQEVLL